MDGTLIFEQKKNASVGHLFPNGGSLCDRQRFAHAAKCQAGRLVFLLLLAGLICTAALLLENNFAWIRSCRLPNDATQGNSATMMDVPVQDCVNSWILSASPEDIKDSDLRPTVANGFLGSIVYQPSLHVNGFYTGRQVHSNHARVPNAISFHVVLPAASNSTSVYELDLRKGVFTERITSENVEVTVKWFAHRIRKHALLVEVEIVARHDLHSDFVLQLVSLTSKNNSDLNILKNYTTEKYSFLQAQPSVPETDDVESPTLYMASSIVPEKLRLPAGTVRLKKAFFNVVHINSSEKHSLSEFASLQLINDEDPGALLREHIEEWAHIWQEGGIDIVGNCSLAAKIYSCFYYILSSLPSRADLNDLDWPYFGISPGSLAHSDVHNYQGHVFWDQDIWMLPAVLPFYPEIVQKVIIDSRLKHLDAAKQKAKSLGFDGAMFPWEAAYTGCETSPAVRLSEIEVHIVGDVAWSIQQYLCTTNDSAFAVQIYPVAIEIAKFWVSRLTWQEGKGYGGLGVMPPDEYHSPVNNSVYTNVIAGKALLLPRLIYERFLTRADVGSVFAPPDPKWEEMAQSIYVPFDAELQYHPEYDGFDPESVTVKQADVILLGYPLLYNMSAEVRHNDLTIYSNITDRVEGPAMTWSMFLVNWLEITDDYARPELRQMFEESFGYTRGPFNIWTEEARGTGATNFVTGMGGFLQTLIHGYLGWRVYEGYAALKPVPIPDSTGYTVHGLKYNGLELDVRVNPTSVELKVWHADASRPFVLISVPTEPKFSLIVGAKIVVKCGVKYYIKHE